MRNYLGLVLAVALGWSLHAVLGSRRGGQPEPDFVVVNCPSGDAAEPRKWVEVDLSPRDFGEGDPAVCHVRFYRGGEVVKQYRGVTRGR